MIRSQDLHDDYLSSFTHTVRLHTPTDTLERFWVGMTGVFFWSAWVSCWTVPSLAYSVSQLPNPWPSRSTFATMTEYSLVIILVGRYESGGYENERGRRLVNAWEGGGFKRGLVWCSHIISTQSMKFFLEVSNFYEFCKQGMLPDGPKYLRGLKPLIFVMCLIDLHIDEKWSMPGQQWSPYSSGVQLYHVYVFE